LHNLRIHIAILLVLGLAKEETSAAAVVVVVQTPAGLAEEPAGDGATSSEETVPTGAGATSCETELSDADATSCATEKLSDADATSCETEKTVPAGAGDLEQKPAGVEVDPSVDGATSVASGTTPDEHETPTGVVADQETPTGVVADPNPKLSDADVEALEIYHKNHPKWGTEVAITHGRIVDKDIMHVVVFVRGTTDAQYDAVLDFGTKSNGRTARKGPHPLLAMGDDRSGPSPPFAGRDELGNSGMYTFHYGARDINNDTIVVKGQVLYICWILLDDCIAAPLILRSLV
jgi:hypothetical protein